MAVVEAVVDPLLAIALRRPFAGRTICVPRGDPRRDGVGWLAGCREVRGYWWVGERVPRIIRRMSVWARGVGLRRDRRRDYPVYHVRVSGVHRWNASFILS